MMALLMPVTLTEAASSMLAPLMRPVAVLWMLLSATAPPMALFAPKAAAPASELIVDSSWPSTVMAAPALPLTVESLSSAVVVLGSAPTKDWPTSLSVIEPERPFWPAPTAAPMDLMVGLLVAVIASVATPASAASSSCAVRTLLIWLIDSAAPAPAFRPAPRLPDSVSTVEVSVAVTVTVLLVSKVALSSMVTPVARASVVLPMRLMPTDTPTPVPLAPPTAAASASMLEVSLAAMSSVFAACTVVSSTVARVSLRMLLTANAPPTASSLKLTLT